MADLSTFYMGLTLKNPIIAASSGLTNSLSDLIELEEAGVSAIVLKSLFEEEIRLELDKDILRMQKENFIYPETIDFYDNIQDNEDTLTNYIKLISEAKRDLSIPIIASINCITSEKWPYFAKTLQESGADGIELNIALLPTDLHRSRTANEKLHFEIIEEVQQHINIPLALKISYFSSNLALFLKNLGDSGINALVLFNRFYSPDINIDDFEVISSNIFSNPGEATIPLRWVALMSGIVKCDLAATTGIHDGYGVIKQLMAGAKAVQVASTLYKNGKRYVSIMRDEIINWMDQHNFNKISDFQGKMSQHNIKTPAAYERIQFMKYYSGK